jgi:hypothetical protein
MHLCDDVKTAIRRAGARIGVTPPGGVAIWAAMRHRAAWRTGPAPARDPYRAEAAEEA